jgi:hypothetical protein
MFSGLYTETVKLTSVSQRHETPLANGVNWLCVILGLLHEKRVYIFVRVSTFYRPQATQKPKKYTENLDLHSSEFQHAFSESN